MNNESKTTENTALERTASQAIGGGGGGGLNQFFCLDPHPRFYCRSWLDAVYGV